MDLILGLGIGIPLFFLLAAVIAFVIILTVKRRRKQQYNTDDDYNRWVHTILYMSCVVQLVFFTTNQRHNNIIIHVKLAV